MSEIKMLPLPVRNYVDGDGLWETATGPYSAEETQAYARTVAEHNVKERDAEIKTLRAEVETLRMGVCGDACLHIAIERDQLKARAERLAEALRELVELKDNVKHTFPNDYEARKPLAWEAARAALRDHDQEGGDD